MIRRPNEPYLKINIAGRFVLNAYRTADRRTAAEPLVQRISDRGRFDTTRGLFFRFGKVGVFVALRGDGPAHRKAATR